MRVLFLTFSFEPEQAKDNRGWRTVVRRLVGRLLARFNVNDTEAGKQGRGLGKVRRSQQ